MSYLTKAMWMASIKEDHQNNSPIIQENTSEEHQNEEESNASDVALEETETKLEDDSLVIDKAKVSDDLEDAVELKINQDTDENSNDQPSVSSDVISEIDSTEDLNANSSDDIIKDQILKAALAGEEAIIQQNVFEEIDQDILEKDYSSAENADELLSDEYGSEDELVPLMETEKSSIDDEDFEATNANPNDADLLNNASFADDEFLDQSASLLEPHYESTSESPFNESIISDEDSDDLTYENEIANIHKALVNLNVPTNDVFSST